MNIVYLGKYTLNHFHASAGSKRVVNQIRYLQKYHRVRVITVSRYSSDYANSLNLRRYDNRFAYLAVLGFYWMYICFFLCVNKRAGKNVIMLESLIELNFSIPVVFGKLIGYKIVHDVIENFFSEGREISAVSRINQVISRLFYKCIPMYTDAIIVISERLLREYSVFGMPILKLYNSVELSSGPLGGDRERGPLTFLYSGTFGLKDGIKDILEAFKGVSQHYTDVKLVLTGRNNSEYFRDCMNLIEGSKTISYLGYLQPNILEVAYRNADVLLAIRDNSEFADHGFPFKLSEYLSIGRPVIASAVSDIPMLFTDYENILLVKPSDVKSIEHKMRFVIENRHLLKDIAAKGYAKCIEYFSIEGIGEQMSAFLAGI